MELFGQKRVCALVPHAVFRVGLVECVGKKQAGRNGKVNTG